MALLNACSSNASGSACQDAVADARDYVDYRNGQSVGSGFNRFDVDFGVFYHPNLDGKGQTGVGLDALIVEHASELDGGSATQFLTSIDDGIESELVLWGDDRLRVQGELLHEYEGLNDANDPLVESFCPNPAGGPTTCLSNRRMEIEGSLTAAGLTDIFVPYTPLGLGAEVATLGIGKVISIGGKTVVRVGDDFIEVAEDGAGGYRFLDEVDNGALDGVPSNWTQLNPVGAQINRPTGFTTYRTPDGDMVHVSPSGLHYGADVQMGLCVHQIESFLLRLFGNAGWNALQDFRGIRIPRKLWRYASYVWGIWKPGGRCQRHSRNERQSHDTR